MGRQTHVYRANGAPSAGCAVRLFWFMSKTVVAPFVTTVAKRTAQAPSGPWALVSLALAMLLSSLDSSIAHVALPTLARTFQASFSSAQWVVLAHLLVVTSLIVSVGRLGDRVGRRRLLVVGIGLFTVTSILSGAAPTLGLLIAARAVQGVSGAIMMALSLAMVGETVPQAKIGRALGWLGTMSALGTALGPSLGGLLISGFGWRAIFLINVPLGVLALFLARRHLPRDRLAPKLTRPDFDRAGTLLLALTLAAYALAVTMGRGHFGWLNGTMLLVSAVGAGLFVCAETKAASPLIALAMFRGPGLTASLVMSALVATVVTTTLVVGPFYLSRALGLEVATIGLVLSAGPLVAALTAVPSGRLVDRFGAEAVTIVGLSGMAVGCVALALLPLATGVSGFIVSLVFLTAGYGMFQTANNTVVMAELRPDQRGRVSGLLNLSRNLGRITGAAVMGAVFARAAATTDLTTAPPETVAYGMQTTFAVAALLIGTALVLAWRSRALAADRLLVPERERRRSHPGEVHRERL